MKVQILISLALAFVLQTDAYIGHRIHLERNQSLKGNLAAFSLNSD